MHGKLHGARALRAFLIALLGLSLASADDEPAQIAQPDFAIYHTKYVHHFQCFPSSRWPKPDPGTEHFTFSASSFTLLCLMHSNVQGANIGGGGQHCKGQSTHHEGEKSTFQASHSF